MGFPLTTRGLLIEIHTHHQWLAELVRHLNEFLPARVMAQDITDDEFAIVRLGGGNDFFRLFYGFREWLFNEHIRPDPCA